MCLIQQYYNETRKSYDKPDLYRCIHNFKDSIEFMGEDFDEDSREEWVENSQEIYATTP